MCGLFGKNRWRTWQWRKIERFRLFWCTHVLKEPSIKDEMGISLEPGPLEKGRIVLLKRKT